MNYKVEFQETTKQFSVGLGEVRNISDGGYERGLEEGKKQGYASGFEEGKTDGYNNGYETGKQEGYDEGYAVNAEKAELLSQVMTAKALFQANTQITNVDLTLPNATDASSMFQHCPNLNNVVVNLPKATSFSYTFGSVTAKKIKIIAPSAISFFCVTRWSKGIEEIEIVGTENVTSWNLAFDSCPVVTIKGELIIKGNTKDAFIACYKLKNISPKSIEVGVSFSYSPLTLESAKAVINALVDYSGTDKEHAHSITFSAQTKALLEAEGNTAPNGKTWLEYATDKGWII
jgi:hypothetical protein